MEASVSSIVSLGQYVSTNNKQKCRDWGLQDSRGAETEIVCLQP